MFVEVFKSKIILFVEDNIFFGMDLQFPMNSFLDEVIGVNHTILLLFKDSKVTVC